MIFFIFQISLLHSNFPISAELIYQLVYTPCSHDSIHRALKKNECFLCITLTSLSWCFIKFRDNIFSYSPLTKEMSVKVKVYSIT